MHSFHSLSKLGLTLKLRTKCSLRVYSFKSFLVLGFRVRPDFVKLCFAKGKGVPIVDVIKLFWRKYRFPQN